MNSENDFSAIAAFYGGAREKNLRLVVSLEDDGWMTPTKYMATFFDLCNIYSCKWTTLHLLEIGITFDIVTVDYYLVLTEFVVAER